MSSRFSRFVFVFILAIFALSAMAALYISTPAGAGLANDSVAYIAGARSILQGRGYSDIWLDSTIEPITHYPPLLSLSLSALGLLGLDPLRGARLLNMFLYGANTVLLGLLAWRMTRSRSAGLWAAALFLLNAFLLRIHVFALSEPLYLLFSLLTFLGFDFYHSHAETRPAKRTTWLALIGLIVSLAFLTRYSALALLPTFGLALLIFNDLPAQTISGWPIWRARLANIITFFCGAAPLMLAWFLRNKLIAGSATNRTFQFHPITTENIQPGFYNLSQFLIPVGTWRQALLKSGLFYWLTAAFGLTLLIWLGLQTWRMLFPGAKTAPHANPIAYTTGLYIFGYLGAVLFSMSFFDASTKFQHRILAPVYVAFLLVLVGFGSWAWRLGGKPTTGARKQSASPLNSIG